MKKIKGILLFGILTLLGIGSSFSQFYELSDLTGSQLLLPSIKHYTSAPRTRYSFTLGNIDYLSSGYAAGFNHGLTNIYACYDSSLNIVGFRDTRSLVTFGNTGTCSSSSNYSLINPSTGEHNVFTFNYLYLSSSTPISPYSERSPVNISSYIYFDFNNLHTNYGTFQDVPDGYIRNKLFLNSVGNYGIVSKSLSDGSFSFRSIFRDSFVFNENTDTLDSLNVYSGILLLHFNDYSNGYYGGAHTLLLFLNDDSISYNYYTGYWSFYQDFSYYNVLPASKGFLTYNNSISDGFSQFMNILTGNSNIILTYGNINTQLQFITYGYEYYSQTNLGGGLFTKTGYVNFGFSEDFSVPDFIDVSQGGGNQSNGSISLSSLYYQCLGPTYNTPDGNPPAWCLNPDGSLINVNDYKDCYFTVNSDGSLSESFYCMVGNIAQEMTWIESGSGGYFAPCSGYDCSVDFIIGQSYINLNPVDVVTTGLVLDMITNLTGWVGRCPFPYVDFGFGNTFKVFNYFKSLGYNIDPFIPFNCAIAGFHAGRYTIFEDLNLTIFDIPILNGDTAKHKILFRFFDVLIIFAIFGIYRFFRKHI